MELSWSALVIHDDPGVRQSLRLCLEAAGARVLGVRSRAAAVETIARGDFDLVLIAIGQHGELDAITELVHVRPATTIVVITAAAMFEVAVEAMRRGARDCLVAPYTPEQVREAALRALAGRTPSALATPGSHEATTIAAGADVSLEELEREHIARIIARSPTLELAARKLGIDSTTLQRKRKRYGLA